MNIHKSNIMEKQETKQTEEIFRNVYEYAQLSFELESSREESLIKQSGQMLTVFSISSVFILTIYQITIKHKNLPANLINVAAVISILFLIVSMLLAIFVSWRYKYKTLLSPLQNMEHILKNKEYFITSAQRDKSFTETINEIWESKKYINDKRAKLIKISMIFYFLSISVILITTFIISVSLLI